MRFPRQGTGMCCHFFSFWDLPDSGIEPTSPTLMGRFFNKATWEAPIFGYLMPTESIVHCEKSKYIYTFSQALQREMTLLTAESYCYISLSSERATERIEDGLTVK